MKKHTLFALGLLFLVHGLQAQRPDSTIQELAKQKMTIFSRLMEQLAAPGLDLTTRARIERTLEGDFLDNRGVYFHQDLTNTLGHQQQLAVSSYFSQLKVLYPNGASLNSSDFQVSPVFYNPGRDMYYMVFRTTRKFRGLNALAKKEVVIEKVIDYQVKLIEGGLLGIDILNSTLSEGPLEVPPGLDILLKDVKSELNYSGSLIPEEFKIEEARKLSAENNEKIQRYEKMEEVMERRDESPGERQARKKREKAEKARLNKEIAKARAERKSLTTHRLHFRLGFGYHVADSTIYQLPNRIVQKKTESWLVKTDVQYKFYGLNRLPDGKWEKAHTMGLFMNYGQQTASNVRNLMGTGHSGPEADTSQPGNRFFEAELGLMLREEFRVSGGFGQMHYPTTTDGIRQLAKQSYMSLTAGISPRLYSFLEMDFNVTGLYLNGTLRPRANVNMVLLLKARKR
jgi:hypothetical protein